MKNNNECTKYAPNKYFSIAFSILNLLILIDIIIKLSIWQLTDRLGLDFFITVGFEALILSVVFFGTSICLAQKGIPLWASNYIDKPFPKKRYFLISLLIGAIFAIYTIFRMFYFGRSTNYLIYDILFGIAFYAIICVIICLIFYLYFYILFKISQKYHNKKTERK